MISWLEVWFWVTGIASLLSGIGSMLFGATCAFIAYQIHKEAKNDRAKRRR